MAREETRKVLLGALEVIISEQGYQHYLKKCRHGVGVPQRRCVAQRGRASSKHHLHCEGFFTISVRNYLLFPLTP